MQPTLNREVIATLQAHRLDDGTTLAHNLTAIFLDVTPRVIDDLCSAYLRGDAKTVARLLSRLYGSSSSLGGARFAELCGNLAHVSLHERPSIISQIGDIRDEYIRLERALRTHLQPRFALSYSA